MGSPYFSRSFIVLPMANLPSEDFVREEYTVYMSKTPVMPATIAPTEKPIVAPTMPKPRNTSTRTRPVLTMDWTINIILLRRKRSIPIKMALAAFISAPVRTRYGSYLN